MLVHTSQHITMYVLAFIYDVYSDFFLCLLNEYAVTMTSTSVFWSMCLTSCVTLIVHDGLLGKKILVFRPSSSLFEFLKKQESNLLTKCLLRKHIHYMCFLALVLSVDMARCSRTALKVLPSHFTWMIIVLFKTTVTCAFTRVFLLNSTWRFSTTWDSTWCYQFA